jgi:hypothetical protein
MGKLARRFNSTKAAVKHAAKQEALPKAGHALLELSGAVGLMVADKNMGNSIGPIPTHPSVAAGVVGVGLMLGGKGKTRKLGLTVAKAALVATAARFVYTGNMSVISGEDGKPQVSDGSKPGAKAQQPQITINISPEMIRDAFRRSAQAETEVVDQAA